MMYDKFNRPLELIEILAGDDPAESRCATPSAYGGSVASVFPSEHIVTFMKVMAALGLRKALLTGKEPLSRPDIVELVSGLGIVRPKMEITIRTSSPLLPRYIQALVQAGAGEIWVAIPTIDRSLFSSITGQPAHTLDELMEGARLGRQLGASVVVEAFNAPGVDRREVAGVASWALSMGYPVRIAERAVEDENNGLMDWLLEEINQVHPLEKDAGRYHWKSVQAGTRLEYITATSQKNCYDCRRLWLSAEGKIKLCNHHHDEHDLGELFENNLCDMDLLEFASKIPLNKPQGFYLRNC
ncbi:MAG: radical SAM protein [Nitrospinota bacterium]|nr:radical SAM protein [Nitrospinota bacterium]